MLCILKNTLRVLKNTLCVLKNLPCVLKNPPCVLKNLPRVLQNPSLPSQPLPQNAVGEGRAGGRAVCVAFPLDGLLDW
jgi:hypothetical protein